MTAAAPVYDVARTEAPSGEQVPELAGLELDMSVLAAAEDTELVPMLEPLVSGYGRWLDRQERGSRRSRRSRLRGSRREAIEGRRAHAGRLGCRRSSCSDARRCRTAFRFANRAMWQQRVHSEAAKARRGRYAVSA